MKKLHPGARWVFRLRGYLSLIFIVFFLSVFGFSMIQLLLREESIGSSGVIIISAIFFVIIVTIILSEIYARLAYNRWLYKIGPESIRLERGIIWKRYSNIPYERVQNIDIHRGIIARILGFSSVMVQTAGYSMPVRRGFGTHAEGSIPAVGTDEAEQIREFVLKKIKGKKQGL